MEVRELKARALERFNERYIKDVKTATDISKRFYRLCKLSEKVFYMNNDYQTYTHSQGRIKALEKEEDEMLQGLKRDLKPFGLTVYYFGIYPSITGIKNGQTDGIEALERFI